MQTEEQTSSLEKHLKLQVQMQTSSNEKHDKQSQKSSPEMSKNKLSPVHISVTHSTSFQPLQMALSRKRLAFKSFRNDLTASWFPGYPSSFTVNLETKAKTPLYSLQKLAIRKNPSIAGKTRTLSKSTGSGKSQHLR